MNEIEKQFFDTFGIEPMIEQCYHFCNRDLNCKECDEATRIYPPITDRILLELICLTGNTNYFLIANEGTLIDVEGLKNSVLHSLTIYSKFHKDLKHQVQALFKEDN